MKVALWVVLALWASTLVVHAEDERDTMENYVVDPKRPCGARCQIQRAMQAWGGLIKVNPDALLAKYRKAEAQGNAFQSLQRSAIEIEQRVEAATRGATPEDSPKRQKTLKRLRRVHHKVMGRVEELSRRPGEKKKAMMKLAHAMDVERVMLRRYEQMATAEASMRQDKDENAMLGESLEAAEASLQPGTSDAVKHALLGLEGAKRNIDNSVAKAVGKLAGSTKDAQLAAEIHESVHAAKQNLAKFQRMKRSEKELMPLRQKSEALHKTVLDAMHAAPDAAGRVAVQLEIMQKADSLTQKDLGEIRFSGDEREEPAEVAALTRLRDHLSHEEDQVAFYQRLSKHQEQSTKIQASLKSLHLKLGSIDPMPLHSSLQALKDSNGSLRPTHQVDLGESNVADDDVAPEKIASDIDQLLSDAEAKRLSAQKRRIQHQVAASDLQDKLSKLQEHHRDASVDDQFLDDSFSDLKEGVQSLHNKYTGAVLGESSSGSKSPQQLASEVDNLLDDAPTPEVFLDEGTLVTSLDDMSNQVPFVSNAEAEADFNADHDPAFTGGRTSASVPTSESREKLSPEGTQAGIESSRTITHKYTAKTSAQKSATVVTPHRPERKLRPDAPADDFGRALKQYYAHRGGLRL
jgi:hypothetical protein